MSAENSRLTRAIQRIAREDPSLRRAIEATKPRGGQPGGVGTGESEGERDRICCDGSTSGSVNPGVDTRDSGDGAQSGLDPGDPAGIGDNLTGLADCATGHPICFEGSDWIPPEGWDDPAAPPILQGWSEGYYYDYRATRGGVVLAERERVLTCGQAKSELLALFSGDCPRVVADIERSRCPSPENTSSSGVTNVACDNDDLTSWSVRIRFCGTGEHDVCQYTSEDPPRETDWPEDGCVNLAIVGGSIVGSKYDPENDGSYSAPRDEIELCDPEDGTSTLIRPSSDGGWKSIESLDGDIDPETGNGYLYAPDGKRIRQISPSEFRDDMV